MKKLTSLLLALPILLGIVLSTSCQPDPQPEPQPKPEPKPTELKIALKSSDLTSVVIAVTVKNADSVMYTSYVKGTRPTDDKIAWKKLEIKADGTSDITIGDLVQGDNYTFEAYAKLGTVKTPNQALDFTTAPVASVITVSDVVGGHNMVSFVVDFKKEDCDGYFYAITPTAEYDKETFLQGCVQSPEGQLANVMVNVSGKMNQNAYGVIPKLNTQYTVAVIGAKLTKEGVLVSHVGDVVETKVSTLSAVQIGSVENAVAVKVAKSTIASASLTFERIPSTKTAGFYGLLITEAELGTSTADQYAAKWLMEKKTNPWGGESPMNIELPVFFDGLSNTFSLDFSELKADTKYIALSIAFDDRGKLGKVSTQNFSTPAIVINDEPGMGLALNADVVSCAVDVTLRPGYVKGFYVAGPDGNYTDETALAEMLANAVSDYQYWTADTRDFAFEYLTPATDYRIYMMGMKADGSFSKMDQIQYTTRPLVFTGASTVAVTMTKKSYDPNTAMYNYQFNLTFSGTAQSADYMMVYPDPDKQETTQELAEKGYYGGGIKNVKGTSFERRLSDYDNGQYMVVVPREANGDLGQPTALKIEGVPAPPAPAQ